MQTEQEHTQPRRAYGAGSVTRLKSGRYRVRVRLPDGRRVGGLFDTREEAESFRATLVDERRQMVERGEIVVEPKREEPMTLARWGETWLQRRRDQKILRGVDNDVRVWRCHVVGTAMAAIPLVELRPRDLREWLRELLAKTTSRGGKTHTLRTQTLKNIFNLVRKALSDACEDELIPSNPAIGVKVKAPRESPETTFLSAEEVALVETTSAIPERARLLYLVAIYTGLREGELWALRWGDVTLTGDRKELTVRHSHEHAPKNGKVQSIPLLPGARKALDRLQALALDDDAAGPDDLVFPAPRGGARPRGDDGGWSSRKVRGVHRVGHREQIGIKRPVRFHDLRHTFASHLVMGTWTSEPLPIVEVSRFLRHSGVGVTQRYAHLSPDHLHGRVARLTATKSTPPPTPAALPPPEAPASVSEALASPAPSEPTPSENPSRSGGPLGPRDPSEFGPRFSYLLSHPWGSNPRPTVYETVALPLS